MRVLDFEDHVAHELARASLATPRRTLRWATFILAVLTVMALVLAPALEMTCLPGLLLGAFALAAGAGLAYVEWQYRANRSLRNQLKAGLRGQSRMTEILSILPDEYFLLNNLKLPGRADDVDHVVIGPNGIFALEAKNHRGRIYWRDGQWCQAKVSRRGRLQPEREIRDPSQQLKRNVGYLRRCIRHTDPGLSRRTRLWIEGAAVFTHPQVYLDLPQTVRDRLPFPALRAQDLPAHILQHVPRHPYSRSDVRRIVSLLSHLQAPG